MNFSTRFGRFAFGLAVALATPAIASAQQAPEAADGPAEASGGEADEDRVVVRGRRELEEAARALVGEVADPVSDNFGIARWDDRVCVGVENIPVDAAQYIVDRISEVALEVGLNPGDPGCTPDIAIVFTTDGPGLAAYLVEEERRLFRPFGGEGGVQQGFEAMDAFVVSAAPVRWWQISMPVTRDGTVAIALPGRGAPTVAGSNSHIRQLIRDELWSCFIIVDVSKLDGANWTQLADYLAMVALAQVDPEGERGAFDSILNLFTEEVPAGGLTDWDVSYLRGLYAFDQELMPRTQRGALADAIAEEMQEIRQETPE